MQLLSTPTFVSWHALRDQSRASSVIESSDGPEVPASAVRGRRTPTFSLDTVPAALTKAHVTTTWAELVVLAGSVLFVDETPRRIVATAGSRVPIVPRVRHHVEPDASAEFYVQFYEPS